MGNVRLITTALLLAVLLLPGRLSAQGMSDEEAKRAFLRSRGQSAPAAPTPPKESPQKARPKPKPAPKPARRVSSPEPPAPRPVRSAPTPEPRRATPPPPEPTLPAPAEATPPPLATPEPRATPTPRPTPEPRRATPPPSASRKRGAIVIEKSGGDEDRDFLPPPPSESRGFLFFRSKAKYKYLTPAVRDAIDKARVRKNRWSYIVVHNSGTRQGNAKAFEYYHRKVRKMPNGMAYHFVIGNGTSSGNGQIEIGSRWRNQINGGHVHSDFLNNIAIGICFVGDYNRDLPTRQQLEALDELIRYVRRRVGKTQGKQAIIKAHKDINPRPTDCPGKKFPYTWLYTRFD